MVLRFVERDLDAGNAELARVLTELHKTVPVTPDAVARARDRYGSLYLRELFARQMSRRFGLISFATDPFHRLRCTTTGSPSSLKATSTSCCATRASTPLGARTGVPPCRRSGQDHRNRTQRPAWPPDQRPSYTQLRGQRGLLHRENAPNRRSEDRKPLGLCQQPLRRQARDQAGVVLVHVRLPPQARRDLQGRHLHPRSARRTSTTTTARSASPCPTRRPASSTSTSPGSRNATPDCPRTRGISFRAAWRRLAASDNAPYVNRERANEADQTSRVPCCRKTRPRNPLGSLTMRSW